MIPRGDAAITVGAGGKVTLDPSKRRCQRHKWVTRGAPGETTIDLGSYEAFVGLRTECFKCGRVKDEAASKRGTNNRKRGNAHELAVARKYGGEKVGPLGGPDDIRGTEFVSQVKTHQALPPAEWRKAFTAMETRGDSRTPRLVLRFLPGQGIPADDYIVVRGADWLDRFGRDE